MIDQLNERQLAYMKLIYQCDQELESYYRTYWSVKRQGYPPPTKEWRRIWYEGYAEYGNSELRDRMREAGLVDSGTGSTFKRLQKLSLIELGSDGERGFVRMTAKGRKVLRDAGIVPKPVKRAARPKREKVKPSWLIEISDGRTAEPDLLAQRIKAIRQASNMGLRAAADEIGDISPSALSRYEGLRANKIPAKVYDRLLRWLESAENDQREQYEQ